MSAGYRLVRKIEEPDNWAQEPGLWLDLLAGCFHDIGDKSSCPSLFEISGIDGLTDVAAAMNLNRDKVSEWVFLISDETVASACGKTPDQTKGRTNDPTVDGWHRQLTNLTVGEISSFLQALYEACGGPTRDGSMVSNGRYAIAKRAVAERLKAWREAERVILPEKLAKNVDSIMRAT